MRLIILISSILLLQGCGSGNSTDDKSLSKLETPGVPASKSVLVELAEIKRGRIEEILDRSSSLQAENQVQVLARTQNPAVELFVEEGDQVAKGQILLRLENDRQKTDYDQAMIQLEKARIDFDNLENLYNQDLISETEYRNAKFTYNQAQLQSETAKRQLDYTEVRAPIKGTITSRTVKVGDQVSNGIPIFEIIDLESTVAIIYVPEQFIPKLKPNMEARLISSTLDNQEFPGFVKRISPIVESKGGVKVVVGVKELGALRPGMWVEVQLVLDANEDALLIPKQSIVYDNDQTFAFKTYTDTNGVVRVKRHLVVPKNADKIHIEPTEGFEVGDLIVIAGQSGLKDTSPIRELDEPDVGSLMSNDSIVQAKTNAIPASKQVPVQSVN